MLNPDKSRRHSKASMHFYVFLVTHLCAEAVAHAGGPYVAVSQSSQVNVTFLAVICNTSIAPMRKVPGSTCCI